MGQGTTTAGTSEPSTEAASLAARALEWSKTEPKRALEVAERAVALARANGESVALIVALRALAASLIALDEYTPSLVPLREALEVARAHGDRGEEARVLFLHGSAHLFLGNHTEASQHLGACLALQRDLGDEPGMARTYHNIARARTDVGDLAGAREFFQLSLHLQEKIGLRDIAGYTLNSLGHTYMSEALGLKADDPRRPEVLRTALHLFERTLALEATADDLQSRGLAMLNLACVHGELGHAERNWAILNETLELARQRGARRLEAMTLRDMGTSHLDAAEHEAAITRFEASLRLFEDLGVRDEPPYLHQSLSRAHEALGDLRRALDHHRLYHNLEIAQQKDAHTRHAQTLAARLELERHRHETELHRLRAQELGEQNLRLQAEAEHLERLSQQDGLTGLANRRALEAHVERQCSAGAPFALAIGDVDRFKAINDRFSHAVGDEVLRHLARILRERCRLTDLAARLGGEEFVLILHGASASEARATCERVRRVVETYDWHTLHPDLRVTISFGYCADRAPGNLPELLATADRYLYAAKNAGRNRVMGG